MKIISPIKRHESIISFSKEHHFGLLLSWKVRRGFTLGIEPLRISKYVIYFFNEELSCHFRDEEEILFSKLQANDLLRQRAEKEHEQLRSLISVIRQEEKNQILLQQFADLLEKHIRFEERELFNYLQSTLKPEELVEISKRIPEVKDVDAGWPDHFWVTEKVSN